jgi:hypothetical protein
MDNPYRAILDLTYHLIDIIRLQGGVSTDWAVVGAKLGVSIVETAQQARTRVSSDMPSPSPQPS